jgi:hypothetical protein
MEYFFDHHGVMGYGIFALKLSQSDYENPYNRALWHSISHHTSRHDMVLGLGIGFGRQ